MRTVLVVSRCLEKGAVWVFFVGIAVEISNFDKAIPQNRYAL